MTDNGYTFEVGCTNEQPAVTPSGNGGHGWNSLSKGDQNTVIVACVSIICIGGVIAGAVFVIKRYQSKQAYTAAMLAKDLGNDDDDQMLRLGNDDVRAGQGATLNGDGNYEDEFEESSWKPETYGNN